MKSLVDYIKESVRVPADYIKEIEKLIEPFGLKCVVRSSGAIHVFDKDKRDSLKNLLFAINYVDYIEWGIRPSERSSYLKKRLEEPLLKIMEK